MDADICCQDMVYMAFVQCMVDINVTISTFVSTPHIVMLANFVASKSAGSQSMVHVATYPRLTCLVIHSLLYASFGQRAHIGRIQIPNVNQLTGPFIFGYSYCDVTEAQNSNYFRTDSTHPLFYML